MADSKKKDKGFSVAGFLFMPQFSLSFQHLSFIKPVFMRTIAMVMEQADILPANHPATQYGLPGVKKYGFFEVMGEAWHNLRNKDANPYQWSILVSIYLMVAAVFVSFASAAMAISGMFVSTATAQLFDSAAGKTDLGGSYPYSASGHAFDNSIPVSGAYSDYGITILDKLLRQGSINKGGLMQNAFGSLMNVYNSGVLVIAGIMLFWIVLSIVVDTAKTGQIGGGRHNMVWAPIRIVFAIGLLIPLGSSGFSSGQFGVMKLAEWGSNFGTRGWQAYISSVESNNVEFLANYGQVNPTSLVTQYARMWICRVAYNASAEEAGALTTREVIKQVENKGISKTKIQSVSFVNKAGQSCGTVKYQSPYNPNILVGLDSSNEDQVDLANYKLMVNYAYASIFVDLGNKSKAGILGDKAKEFACGFTSRHILSGAGGDPLKDMGYNEKCAAVDVCGAQRDTPTQEGKYPDAACLNDMVKTYHDEVKSALNDNRSLIEGIVDRALSSQTIREKSWPAMGLWFMNIKKYNSVLAEMRQPQVSITPTAPMGNSIHYAKVQEILGMYDKWWKNISVSSTDTGPTSTAAIRDSQKISSDGGVKIKPSKIDEDVINKLKGGAADSSTVNTFVDVMGFGFFTNWAIDADDPADKNLYSLTKLAKMGESLENTAMLGYGTILVFRVMGAFVTGMTTGEVSAGAFGFSASAGGFMGFLEAFKALMGGPVMSMLTSAVTSVFLASLVLKYYIPMLPAIRVAFAVLTWMISIFEAVVMVPIAALAHITTEGEGLASGVGKQAWIVWLNVLFRPILTVIGFVGALLVIGTFTVYFNSIYPEIASASTSGFMGIISSVIYIVIYVFILYTVANSAFKLMDIIPSAMFKYMGGSADQSFDSDISSVVSKATSPLGDAIAASNPNNEPLTYTKKPKAGGEEAKK